MGGMRYRLRTLLILLAIMPPLLAYGWSLRPRRQPPKTITFTVWESAFLTPPVRPLGVARSRLREALQRNGACFPDTPEIETGGDATGKQ
jgi:hypothetical protein